MRFHVEMDPLVTWEADVNNRANERKRRQVYRSEVHKQLPFDPKGMDDPAPALEINTTGTQEPPFSITRNDLIGKVETHLDTANLAKPDFG